MVCDAGCWSSGSEEFEVEQVEGLQGAPGGGGVGSEGMSQRGLRSLVSGKAESEGGGLVKVADSWGRGGALVGSTKFPLSWPVEDINPEKFSLGVGGIGKFAGVSV